MFAFYQSMLLFDLSALIIGRGVVLLGVKNIAVAT